MRSRALTGFALLVVLLTAFALWRLFELRFAGGDIYPPYSSLRADPLGARALFESLAELPDHEARRLFEPLDTLESGRGTTLYVLGVGSGAFNRVLASEARDLEAFLTTGGRVVFAFLPDAVKPREQRRRERRAEREAEEKQKKKTGNDSKKEPAESKEKSEEPDDEKSDRPTPGDDEDEDGAAGLRLVSLHERWGFEVQYEPLKRDDDGVPQPVTARRTADAPPALPAALAWHSGASLVLSNTAWRAHYRHGTNTVLAERTFGAGTLVLATDSYALSNEALRRERQTGLLAWFAGGRTRHVFDETHLGVELTPGVATLARRYRLHGLFASLFLLAVLFIWKNAASFVPPHESLDPAAGALAGRGGIEGFINVLRRAVPASNLTAVCLAEWRRAFAHQRRDLAHRAAAAEAALQAAAPPPGRARDPVADYRLASRALSRRRT